MKAPRGAFQKSDGDLPTVYRALIDSPEVAIDALIAGVAGEALGIEPELILRTLFADPGMKRAMSGFVRYHWSHRSTVAGSILAARRAGSHAAATATAARRPAVAARVNGSFGSMPNNWLSNKR